MPFKRKAFHSERWVYELEIKKAFSFQVLEALTKPGNKVIEMIIGAYASEKV